MCADVFKKIDELNDTYLDVWEQACTIESPTGDKAAVDACGNFFAKMAEERGWEVEYSRQEVSGDVVCITMNPHVDAAALIRLMSLHIWNLLRRLQSEWLPSPVAFKTAGVTDNNRK